MRVGKFLYQKLIQQRRLPPRSNSHETITYHAPHILSRYAQTFSYHPPIYTQLTHQIQLGTIAITYPYSGTGESA